MMLNLLLLIGTIFCPRPVVGEEEKVTVVFHRVQWDSNLLNSEIARLIVQKSFPHVNTAYVEIEGPRDAVEEILHNVDVAAVSMELWPSEVNDALRSVIDYGAAEIVKEIGMVAQIGWFVPDYVVEQYPEADSWEFYKSDSTARLFATPETDPLGRFLHGSPTWSNSMEIHMVKNLEIPFVVDFAGSQTAQVEILGEAVKKRQPVLMYHWVPTATVWHYNLVRVQLPEVTNECIAFLEYDQSSYNCDYPADDPPMIVVSSVLREKAPDVYAFLKKFTITNEDLRPLLPQIAFQNRTFEEVAAEWVENNRGKWEAWLPDASALTVDSGALPMPLGLVAAVGALVMLLLL